MIDDDAIRAMELRYPSSDVIIRILKQNRFVKEIEKEESSDHCKR